MYDLLWSLVVIAVFLGYAVVFLVPFIGVYVLCKGFSDWVDQANERHRAILRLTALAEEDHRHRQSQRY